MTDLLPCPFCGSPIKHVESWAKSFNPPRLWHEWHHVDDNECWIRLKGKIVCSANHLVENQERAIRFWNTRANPQSLSGCLHPGKEPLSCQYEGKCLSDACNHSGKTWYGPRMTLEAQDPNVLYPPKETT